MSIVEVRDHALWIKHIHGNEELKAKLSALASGDLIELTVDGFRGHWKKMDDGRDGRPTPGIKPIGPARERWHVLNDTDRGALVEILETDESALKAPPARAQVVAFHPSDVLGRAISAMKSQAS